MKKPGAIEYKMSETMAKALLKERKGSEELKMNPQDYLVKVVNESFCLSRNCVKVIPY